MSNCLFTVDDVPRFSTALVVSARQACLPTKGPPFETARARNSHFGVPGGKLRTMALIAHRFHSIEADGPWTSPPFPPKERRHIVQGVIGGYLMGRPRWAEDLDGNFIYGLDAKGKEIKSAPSASVAGGRRHTTKKFETEAEQVASTNGWTVAYAAGWLDGRTQARHGQRRDPSLQTAKDDYARGYSLGYSEAASTTGARHHATKKSPTQLQREIDEALANPSSKTKVPTNREGLTWEEWRNAARFAAPHTCLTPGLIKGWRSEWRKGTDPSEMGRSHSTKKPNIPKTGLPVRDDVTELEYHRPPTAREKRFGHGATHYRTFPVEEAVIPGTRIAKKWLVASDDGLRYYR